MNVNVNVKFLGDKDTSQTEVMTKNGKKAVYIFKYTKGNEQRRQIRDKAYTFFGGVSNGMKETLPAIALIASVSVASLLVRKNKTN